MYRHIYILNCIYTGCTYIYVYIYIYIYLCTDIVNNGINTSCTELWSQLVKKVAYSCGAIVAMHLY